MTATVGDHLLLALAAACLLVGGRIILAFWQTLDEEVAEEPEPYDWARDSGILNSWADDAMAESELLRVLPYPKEDR